MRVVQYILYILSFFLYSNLILGSSVRAEPKTEAVKDYSKNNIQNFNKNSILSGPFLKLSNVYFPRFSKQEPTLLSNENIKNVDHDVPANVPASLDFSKEQFKMVTPSEQSISLKHYSMIDADKVDQKYPVQSIQNGKEIRFDNKFMDKPIYNYIEALKNASQYKYVSINIPEIFATYVVELLRTGNRLSSELIQKSFEWKVPSALNANLENLYMGMDTLNFLCDPTQNFTVYDKVRDSHNKWMTDDMDKYIQNLRERYVHVPDKILAIYVTHFLSDSLNQNYEQKKVLEKGLIWSSDISKNDLTKPIVISPDLLLSKTSSEDMVTNLPIYENGIDSRDLHYFQKLYLTIEAIERINKENIQYQSIVNGHQLPLEPEKLLYDRIDDAIKTPGSIQGFLLRSGVTRDHMKNPTVEEIDQAQTKLEENYSSYIDFKKNSQDRKAFEQLQVDFINLNQNIFAFSQEHKILVDNFNFRSLTGKKNENIEALINVNLKFSKQINELIINQKYVDFINSFLPSAAKNISYTDMNKQYDEMKAQFSVLERSNASSNDIFIRKYLKLQNDAVLNLLDPVVTGIELKIKEISKEEIESTEMNKNELMSLQKYEDNIIPAMKALNGVDFFEGCQLKAQKNLKIEERKKQSNDSGIESKRNMYIMQGVLEQFTLDLKNVQVSYQLLERQAQSIVDQNLKDNSFNDVVLNTLKQCEIAVPSDSFGYNKILLSLSNLINKYQILPFEKQDIGQITLSLIDLLIQYPDNKTLALYNQVFIELHTRLQGEQIKNDRIEQCLTKITEEKIPLQLGIASIVAFEKNELASEKNGSVFNLNQAINRLNEALNKLLNEKSQNNSQKTINKSIIFLNSDFIKSKQDLFNVCETILTELIKKQREEQEDNRIYQLNKNLSDALNNVLEGNIVEAGNKVLGAGSNALGVAGEVNTVLTQYVFSVIDPIKANLSPQALIGIATIISGVTPILIGIQQSNTSIDEKKRLQQGLIVNMMEDIANLVIADQTGADAHIVATQDAQAILTSGLFNKAINLLVPNEQSSFSHNSPVGNLNYVSNVAKFNAENYAVLHNQVKPSSKFNSFTSSNNQYQSRNY